MRYAGTIVFALVVGFLPAAAILADEVSYEADLLPILKRRCGACHITGQEPGNMALIPGKAYDALVGKDSVELVSMKRVQPGEPDNSYLIHKLQGTHVEIGGTGNRMPFHQGPLPKKHLEQFRAWIAAGAPRN